MKQMSK